MNTKRRSTSTASIVTVALAVVGIVTLAVAVSVDGPPANAAASPSAPLTALASPSPSLAVDPSIPPPAAPSAAAPKPEPTPKPTPAPVKAAVWSKPATVPGLSGCDAVVAAVDDRGSDHLAATCSHGNGSELRYSDSTNGRDWTTATLKAPTGRYELDPQLALDGGKLYLAYSRVAPTDGGCGDDGLTDVGVYVRSRTLPNGRWSDPKRIGTVGDHVQSFRVNHAVLHATVTADDGSSTTYETLTGGTLRRYTIGDAAGQTSLRVGDDGMGRIGYESTHGISYGMVSGNKFSSVTIPNSTNGWAPVLTLAPGNTAYLLWTRSYHGAGCAGPGPDPEDGTYFATDATGTWVSSRLTPLTGSASMTVDPATGELRAVVFDASRIVFFHRLPGADWTHETAARAMGSSVQLRQNPRSGALFVAYVAWPIDGDPSIDVASRR